MGWAKSKTCLWAPRLCHFGVMPVAHPLRRVAITGLGAVTPVGLTAPATWDSFSAGRSGIWPITRIDASGCTARTPREVKRFAPTAPDETLLHPRGRDSNAVTAGLSPKPLPM